MANTPAKILIVEDDIPYCMDLGRQFQAAGFEVVMAYDAGEAQDLCKSGKLPQWALIDAFRLPQGQFTSKFNVPLHDSWGVELADWISKTFPKIKIVGYSNSAPQEICDWFSKSGEAYVRKSSFDNNSFAQTLRRVFQTAPPKCFIVHGHDTVARDTLRKMLRRCFKIKEVIVLDRQVNQGASVIEKLEREASDSDVAFILFTPDDSILPSGGTGQIYQQSRPNVFIEAGWFQGRFGRLTGRVILLRDKRAYWPSDFQGLVWIDISNGVDKAASDIKRELSDIGVIP